jgi:hypothetical protein
MELKMPAAAKGPANNRAGWDVGCKWPGWIEKI